MKTKLHLLIVLLCVLALPAARAADGPRTIVIVANDTLRFSVMRIEAHPGEVLHVQLRNEGTLPKNGMGHNWILLQANADPMKYAMAAIPAAANEYMPKALASEVIAYIPLLGPKEVGDVTFTCPASPGKYTYVCSCNGHSMAGMKGELIVK